MSGPTERVRRLASRCLHLAWWESREPPYTGLVLGSWRADMADAILMAAPPALRQDLRGLPHAEAADRTLALLQEGDPAVIVGGRLYRAGGETRPDLLLVGDPLDQGLPGLCLVALVAAARLRSGNEHRQILALAHTAALLEEAGFAPAEVELWWIEPRWRRPEAGPNLGLFQRKAVLERVQGRLGAARAEAQRWARTLAAETPPSAHRGPNCERPEACPRLGICWPPAPGPTRLVQLPGGKDLLSKLRLQTWLPDDLAAREVFDELKPLQRQALEAHESGRPWVGQGLARALARPARPLLFFDIEGYGPPVPRQPGGAPFASKPVQWSVHRLDADGELSHTDALIEGEGDPTAACADGLSAVLDGEGTPVAWSKGEIEMLRRTRDPRLQRIAGRVVPIIPILQAGFYHPGFEGGWSLKAVLPALVPELSHKALAIGDGRAALRAWQRLLHPGTAEADRAALREALAEYCGLDTLGMVEVWRALEGWAAKG